MTHPSTPTPQDELGFAMPKPARVSKLLVVAVLLLAAAAVIVFVYLPRRHDHEAASDAANAAAGGVADSGVPRVQVMHPTVASSDHQFTLAGTVQPLQETTIYPRITGYVHDWKVDMGQKVTAGEVLAEIDVPDLDDQLAQARAQLAQARAQLAEAKASKQFSATNLTRYEGLSQGDVVAKVDVEQAREKAASDEATVTAAQASIGAEQANVDRLIEQKSWAKVVAPFDGTITARSVERGALVTAGNSTPLYTIATTDPVRVFVQAPQSVALAVQPGVTATVTVREHPGRNFTGTVAHVAGALDPDARTMNTEIRIPNGDNALLTGMYVQASLDLKVAHEVLEIPGTALFTDSNGTRVAVVDADNILHLVPVTIERDTGATLQIATGIKADDRVVTIASATLADGETVEAVEPPPPPTAAAGAGSAGGPPPSK